MATKGKLEEVSVEAIEIDGGTQMRERIDEKTVAEYAERMQEGDEFPAAFVMFDGKKYWLVDGFHRYHAARRAGLGTLYCEVAKGTRDDARWEATAANPHHGLKRTNADKKAAVVGALKHPKAAGMSDNKIAAHVSVHPDTVAKYRAELESTTGNPVVTARTGADGRTINTANIGSASRSTPSEPAWVQTDEDAEPVLSDEDWNAAEADESAAKDRKSTAKTYLKGADNALGALQDNVANARRSGAQVPSIDQFCRGVHEAIAQGRKSL